MAFNPNPQQREKMRKGRVTETGAGRIFRLFGTRGTLEYFGFTLDPGAVDLEAAGLSKAVSRKAGKRSRWLGDTAGQSVKANTANVAFYPSRRGTALPGEPITFKVLSTGERWTLNLDGDIGSLIAYMVSNRPPVDVQLYSKTGAPYSAPILAIDPTP